MAHAGFLVSIALLGLAAKMPEMAEQCMPGIDFDVRGGVDYWAVCVSGEKRTVVGDDRPRLAVTLSVDEQSKGKDLEWVALPPLGKDRVVSQAIADGQLELQRVVSHAASNEFLIEVSVTNRSGVDSNAVGLFISLGDTVSEPQTGPRTLADRLYAIDKAVIRQGDGHWRALAESEIGSTLALQSRDLAVIFDANRPGMAVRDTAASADIEYRQWRVRFEIGSLAPGGHWSVRQKVIVLPTSSAVLETAGYGDLIYSDLWSPISRLSQWIEKFVARVGRWLGSLGGAIIVLAILVRLGTLPATRWAQRAQARFNRAQEKMRQPIAEVRRKYKGAEQSERILQLYKKYDVSPFSGLKGSVGLFVQIPFLLAFFHVTTFSDLFNGVAFLWIDDLSLADSLIELPFFVPLMGAQFNVLPVLLLILNGMSIHRETSGNGKPPIGMIVFSAVIVVVFYSFCAAVVLYWVIINVTQLVERRMFEHLDSQGHGGAQT